MRNTFIVVGVFYVIMFIVTLIERNSIKLLVQPKQEIRLFT